MHIFSFVLVIIDVAIHVHFKLLRIRPRCLYNRQQLLSFIRG